MYSYLYYVIVDRRVNSVLKNKNGKVITCSTLKDCYDYLTYNLKIDDDNEIKNYDFVLKQSNN